MKKMDFYKKISIVFMAITIICIVLCIVSTTLLIKENKGYEDCKQVSSGTLSSCVTQETNNNTYYFTYNCKYSICYCTCKANCKSCKGLYRKIT